MAETIWRRHLEKVIETITEGVVVIDARGHIIYANTAAERILGLARDEVTSRAYNTASWQFTTEEGDAFPEEEMPFARVLRERRPVHGIEQGLLREDGTRVLVAVNAAPYFSKRGALLGVVATLTDITAFKKAQRESKDYQAELRVIAKITDTAIRTLDIERLLSNLLKTLSEAMKADAAVILIMEDDVLRVRAAIGMEEEQYEGLALKPGEGFSGAVAATLEPIYIEDAQTSPIIKCDFLQRAGVHSMLGVPLTHRGSILGVLHVGWKSVHPQSPREIRLLTLMADRIAIAISHSQLYEVTKEAQRQAKYELEMSSLLLKAAHTLSSSLELQAILEALADVIAEATGRSRIHIGLLDKENDELEVKVVWGKPKLVSGSTYNVNDIARQLLKAFKIKKPVVVDFDTSDIPVAYKQFAIEHGLRLFLIVPLIVRGEVIGGLGIDEPRQDKPFTERDIELAEGIAAHAATAIENANLHAQTEVELQRTTLLQDIATTAAANPDIHVAASKILKAVKRHMRIINGDIKIFDEERRMFRVLAMYGLPQRIARESKELPITASDLLSIRAVKTRMVQTHAEDILNPDRLQAIKEAGIENARYMVVPIQYHDRVIGTVSMAFDGKRAFTENELELCRSIAHIIGQTIENARLYEAERSIANILQEAILIMPDKIHGIDFGYLYRSATVEARVGGDFYDIFEVERDKIGILIGDVSGKGVEAAALTSIVKNTIKAHAYENSTPAMILSKANDLLVKTTPAQIFVTVFFGILNTNTGSLSYCSAGHPPTIIRRRSGAVDLLTKYSPAIGAFPGLSYRSGRIKLKKGDTFILYTDGVIEARSNGSLYGEERLIACTKQLGPAPVREVPHSIYNDVTSYCQGNLSDDIAILSIALDTNNHIQANA